MECSGCTRPRAPTGVAAQQPQNSAAVSCKPRDHHHFHHRHHRNHHHHHHLFRKPEPMPKHSLSPNPRIKRETCCCLPSAFPKQRGQVTTSGSCSKGSLRRIRIRGTSKLVEDLRERFAMNLRKQVSCFSAQVLRNCYQYLARL